jgi:hypothetical protein
MVLSTIKALFLSLRSANVLKAVSIIRARLMSCESTMRQLEGSIP